MLANSSKGIRMGKVRVKKRNETHLDPQNSFIEDLEKVLQVFHHDLDVIEKKYHKDMSEEWKRKFMKEDSDSDCSEKNNEFMKRTLDNIN